MLATGGRADSLLYIRTAIAPLVLQRSVVAASIAAAPIMVAAPSVALSQVDDGGGNAAPPPLAPGGAVPDNSTLGPIANTGAAPHKFDDGLYDRIASLAGATFEDGDYGVYDGERYYDVLVVVSRDDGDGRTPDETADENKASVVRILEEVGARNILAAESLSFVTASVPVADVPGFSLNEEVYRIGDGEQEVTPDVDTARRTTHATAAELAAVNALPRSAVPIGSGVTVAVVDTGINSVFLNGRVVDRSYCSGDCSIVSGRLVGQNTTDVDHLNSDSSTHGTRVAQVLAASGMSLHNGTASGVSILDAMIGNGSSVPANMFVNRMAHLLDWSHAHAADVANLSFSSGYCGNTWESAFNLIVNEAVDKGMVVVKSAANRGHGYNTVTNPGCAHNVITVGGVNDRTPGQLTMYTESSRGPTTDADRRMVPHLAAPAVRIQTLDTTTGSATSPRYGTSYAAPQVSAAAALMLQAKPELAPAAVKAALLLGADWQGPATCTSSMYETSTSTTSGCSYLNQPDNRTAGGRASIASTALLNNAGLGVLDVAESLRYAKLHRQHVVYDHLQPASGADTASKQYTFTVAGAPTQVKIVLAWMAHPHGGIDEQPARARAGHAAPPANLDFAVAGPNSQSVSANSANQTTEFAVFNAASNGRYTVTVSGSGLSTINKPVQTFALASTEALTPTPPSNRAPAALARSLYVSPGMEVPVRLHATDADGDAVSFHVSRDPTKGTVSTDELVTPTVSRVLYTPDDNFTGTDLFRVVPSDGTAIGTPAYISLRSESLPPGATDAAAFVPAVQVWHSAAVPPGRAVSDYSQSFSGPGSAASAIHVGSVDAEGVDLSLTTSTGLTYRVAVPSDGSRTIQFSSPLTIRSATLHSDGLDEEAVDDHNSDPSAGPDFALRLGYSLSSCQPSSSSSSSACPSSSKYYSTTAPALTVRDNTRSQADSSSIPVHVNGTSTAITVSVDVSHRWIGDVKLTLVSPNGTEAVLHNRAGGSADDIRTSYHSSSNAALRALVGPGMQGDWTLKAGDYVRGFAGVLNSWSIDVTYTPAAPPPPPATPASTVTAFSDGFESDLSKWTETGEGDWRISTSQAHRESTLPGKAASNRVLHSDNCDSSCTMTLKTPLDLTGYSSATLSFWRFVDSSIDRGEYLRVQASDGTTWSTIYSWSHGTGDDDRWHRETYDLSPYLSSTAFSLKFVTRQSSSAEDVQIDDVVINATSTRGTTAPTAPPTTPAPTTPSGHSVYVMDADDKEVIVFSSAGSYLGTLVSSGSAGLGKSYGLDFGSDGHLYVSDRVAKTIRKYNGATGSPISASWATTSGSPYGLVWKGGTLYVATTSGIERFSSTGTALGTFGDAHTRPVTTGALRTLTPYDVVFCPDNRMYVADRSWHKILYYTSTSGTYQGTISGTASPNTQRLIGLACGSAMSGSGTSLYQSGGDPGRVNEISTSTRSLVRAVTSHIDEPYGMDITSSGILYVANRDSDEITKVQSGTASVFASGNDMDGPRDVVTGPVYSAPSGSSASSAPSGSSATTLPDNDAPSVSLTHGGVPVMAPVPATAGDRVALQAAAADPDGDRIAISAASDEIPASLISMTDHGNGTASLVLDTAGLASSPAGTPYVFWINASDGRDHELEPYAVLVSPSTPAAAPKN